MHTLSKNIGIIQCLKPQTLQSAALNSGNLDLQGAGSLAVVVLLGAIADTLDATHRVDIKIEHADDDGTGNPGSFSACADADVIDYIGLSSGIFAVIDSNSEDERRIVVEYQGGKRFVKVTATPVSLTTGGPVAMLALKGNLAARPADNR